MLDRIRQELRAQRERIFSDPSADEPHRDYITRAIELFDNEDAVRLMATPEIMAILHLLGHPYEEAREMALKVEAEVDRKYRFVDPDRFQGR